MGWLRNSVSMRGPGVFCATAQGMGTMGWVIHGATWDAGMFGAKPFMIPKRTNQEGNNEAHRISQ